MRALILGILSFLMVWLLLSMVFGWMIMCVIHYIIGTPYNFWISMMLGILFVAVVSAFYRKE